MANNTLIDKIWKKHVIAKNNDKDLLYIDLHLTHEVTSPQAFEGLIRAKRKLRRPDLTIATADHDVPTIPNIEPSELAKKQLEVQIKNCKKFNVELHSINSPKQGIVHVIAPELGLTLPGMTIVCGDSHTSTHGAFGALGFGIGTSQIEHVMATQTLWMEKPKNLRINIIGEKTNEITSKDIALYVLRTVGTSFGTGYFIEFAGSVVEKMSMESRMTLCNMAIEIGARGGVIAPDKTTFAYLKHCPKAPQNNQLSAAIKVWETYKSDENAVFDKEIDIDITKISPQVTWGIKPDQVIGINDSIPTNPGNTNKNLTEAEYNRAIKYMESIPGSSIGSIKIDTVFIGSCTNGRIEDLREVAKILKGNKIAEQIKVIISPGSMGVKKVAEIEQLDKIFIAAGCEWRLPGCSMCIAMNGDAAAPGSRVLSTSNRNFINRQGKNVKTYLASPKTAAFTALKGYIASEK